MSGRLTFVETTYHYADEMSQPSCHDTSGVRTLGKDEQPYSRIIKVDESWQEIDGGWITEKGGNVGLVIIKNLEGKFTVNPTAEQRLEVESRTVDIGLFNGSPVVTESANAVQFVPVLESARINPVDFSSLRIRCRKGIAKVSVTVFPE